MRYICYLFLFVSAAFSQEQRFQIVEVENLYLNTANIPDAQPTGKNKSLIKIDTKTGDTWLLTFESRLTEANEDSLRARFKRGSEEGVTSIFVPAWKKIDNNYTEQGFNIWQPKIKK